jgi:3-oxoacyl-(acyl-carrier-protein) synthase
MSAGQGVGAGRGTARRRVVVTGAGVVSPLGDSAAGLHRALCEGRSALRPVELFATDGMGARRAGEVRPFDPQVYLGDRNLRPLDRTSRLVAAAVGLALADSGWTAERRAAHDVGLVLGTMFCSLRTIAEFDRRSLQLGPSHASPLDFANSVINAAAGQAAIWHGLRGVNSTVSAGEASGLAAIAQAADLIRGGRAEAVLAGGAEELCFESFFGMHQAGRLCGGGGAPEVPVPFDARRNGFALSEGAAVLMLEEAGAAAARGARVRAEVLGHGAAFGADGGFARRGGGGVRGGGAVRGGGPPAGEAGAWAASAGGTGSGGPGSSEPGSGGPRFSGAGLSGTGSGGPGSGGLESSGVGGDARALVAAAGLEARAAAMARAIRLALADAGVGPGEIDFLSAAASGSVAGDLAEGLGIVAALGERAGELPIAAVKASLGEALGAGGAFQAVDLIEVFADGVLPGIAGLERMEDGLELGGARAAARRLGAARRALATTWNDGGQCCAVVMGSC